VRDVREEEKRNELDGHISRKWPEPLLLNSLIFFSSPSLPPTFLFLFYIYIYIYKKKAMKRTLEKDIHSMPNEEAALPMTARSFHKLLVSAKSNFLIWKSSTFVLSLCPRISYFFTWNPHKKS
jgi:hypothetical protein